ncbi:MAG: dockerin type I domain-containing protein [Rubripirellula sp.]
MSLAAWFDRILDRPSQARRQHRRRRKKSSVASFETLERRNLLATVVGYEGENGQFEVTRFVSDANNSLGLDGVAEIRVSPATQDRNIYVLMQFNPTTETPDAFGTTLILANDGQLFDPGIAFLPNGFPRDFRPDPIFVSAGVTHQNLFSEFRDALDLETADLFDARRTVDVSLFELLDDSAGEVVKLDEVRIPVVDIVGGDFTFFPQVDPDNDPIVFQTPDVTVPLDNLRRIDGSLPLANPRFDPLVIPELGPFFEDPVFGERDTFEPVTSGLAGLVKGSVRDEQLISGGFSVTVSAPAIRDIVFIAPNEAEPFRIIDPRTGRNIALTGGLERIESKPMMFPPGTSEFAIDLSEALDTPGFAGVGGPLARNPQSLQELTLDGVFTFSILNQNGDFVESIEVFPRILQDVNLTTGYQTDANHVAGQQTELTVILDQYFRQVPVPGGGFTDNPATITVDFGDGSEVVTLDLPQFADDANRGSFEHDFRRVFSHVYNEPGEFTSRVTFEDSAGNTRVSVNTIDIQPDVNVSFFPSRFIRKDAETGVVSVIFQMRTEDFNSPDVLIRSKVAFNGEIVETELPQVISQNTSVTRFEAKAEVGLLPGSDEANEISGDTAIVAEVIVDINDPVTFESQKFTVSRQESLFIAPLLQGGFLEAPFVSQNRLFQMTGGRLPKTGENGFRNYAPEFHTNDELLGKLEIEVTAPMIRQGDELVNIVRQFPFDEGPGLRDIRLAILTEGLATHFVATPESFGRDDLTVNTADPQFVYRLLRVDDDGFETQLDELIVPLGDTGGPSAVPDGDGNLVTGFTATDPFIFIDVRAPDDPTTTDTGARIEFQEAVLLSNGDTEPFEEVRAIIHAYNFDDETEFSLVWESSTGDIDLPVDVFNSPFLGGGKQGSFSGPVLQDGGRLVARVTGVIDELPGNSLTVETRQPLRVTNIAPQIINLDPREPSKLNGIAGNNTVIVGIETAPDIDRSRISFSQNPMHTAAGIFDPGDDTQQVRIDWGDGETSELDINGFQFDTLTQHTYTDQFLAALPEEGPFFINDQFVTGRFVRPVVTTFDGQETATETLRIQVLENLPIQILAGNDDINDRNTVIDVVNPDDITLVLPPELITSAEQIGFELNVTIDSAHTEPQEFRLIREESTPADQLRFAGPFELFVPFDPNTGRISLTRTDGVQIPRFSLPDGEFESVPFTIRAETEDGSGSGEIPIVDQGAFVEAVEVQKNASGKISGSVTLGGSNPNGTDVELQFVGGGSTTVNVPSGQTQVTFENIGGFESIAPVGSTVIASSAGRDGTEAGLIEEAKKVFDLDIQVLGNQVAGDQQTVRINITELVADAAQRSQNEGGGINVDFSIQSGNLPIFMNLEFQLQTDGTVSITPSVSQFSLPVNPFVNEIDGQTFLDFDQIFAADRTVIEIGSIADCITGEFVYVTENVAPSLTTPTKTALSEVGTLNVEFEVTDTQGELIQVRSIRNSTGEISTTTVRVVDGVALVRQNDLFPGIEVGEQITVVVNDGEASGTSTIELVEKPDLNLAVSASQQIDQGSETNIEIDITDAINEVAEGLRVDFTIDTTGDGVTQPVNVVLTPDPFLTFDVELENNSLGLDFEVVTADDGSDNPRIILVLKDVPFPEEGTFDITIGDGQFACATGSTSIMVVNDIPQFQLDSLANAGTTVEFTGTVTDADGSTVTFELGDFSSLPISSAAGSSSVNETIDVGSDAEGQILTVTVEDADGAVEQQTFVIPKVDFCRNHPFFPGHVTYAGDVTVALDGNTVLINGDEENNGFTVIADNRGIVAVPIGGTTINGAAAPFVIFAGVEVMPGNLIIEDVGDGDDFVCLNGFDITGALDATMNLGDDAFLSNDVAVTESIQLQLDEGNDRADLTGTTTDDLAILNGSEGNDTIIGTNSNDQISGGDGIDELRGGVGNDDFLVAELIDSVIAGGDGENRLLGRGASAAIDFDAAVDDSLSEIGQIELDPNAANSLRFSPESVRRVIADVVDLLVRGDTDDQIDIGEGWQQQAPETIDGQFHQVFSVDEQVLRIASGRPFQNVLQPSDVNGDGNTTAIDALRIINALGSSGIAPVPLDAARPVDGGLEITFEDVNGDGQISALDALIVINELASQFQSNAVGELISHRTIRQGFLNEDDGDADTDEIKLF